MCSGSEAGYHLRLIDFVYHSTLGLGDLGEAEGARELERLPERFRVDI